MLTNDAFFQNDHKKFSQAETHSGLSSSIITAYASANTLSRKM
jgi:hypothetical protein